MEIANIKADMMRLWKDTFHDSDEYVRLIFDTYFDPQFVVTEYKEGKLIAALLGIPYEFGNKVNHVTGLYLCGLATDPAHRRQGIMTRLIKGAEKIAADKNISFLFLIPANDGLYKYYHDRGFVASFYKSTDRYTSVHDFDKEFHNLLAAKENPERTVRLKYYEGIKVNSIDSLDRIIDVDESVSTFISGCESYAKGLKIMHSRKDIRTAIEECIISGGELYYSSVDGRITGVAFTSSDRGVQEKMIRIYCLISLNRESRYKLLDAIKYKNKDYPITCAHHIAQRRDGKELWEPFYEIVPPEAKSVPAVAFIERVYDPASHVKMYGMSKILNLYEILKFMNKEWRGLKYSIFVKEE